MLSLIPQILWLAPLSSTILRLGAGLTLIYVGYVVMVRRGEYINLQLPIIGHPARWMLWVSGIVVTIDGFAILLGYGTQVAAIVGMVIALKHIVLPKRYESLRPLPRSTYALLFLMCAALLLTGAGPFGLDLPL
ncbi:MAG TPA: hypothetical protein VMU13_00865 [Candidatus Paceibacterota bacterium]|nr:hypothetical protein [Candidatus Paceibacterota bacterium]